jgi:hypothetical protein
MTDPMAEDTKFLELVLIFQQAAWQGLGKVQNQESGKTEPNLPQASHAIDMLAMLKNKTSGNLSEPEQNLIDNALTQLRLNFVEVQKEEAAKPPEAAPEKPENPPVEPESDPASTESPETS